MAVKLVSVGPRSAIVEQVGFFQRRKNPESRRRKKHTFAYMSTKRAWGGAQGMRPCPPKKGVSNAFSCKSCIGLPPQPIQPSQDW